LNKLLEVETRLAEYLEGDTVGIYFEQAADRLANLGWTARR
jgi:hypothetical protein